MLRLWELSMSRMSASRDRCVVEKNKPNQPWCGERGPLKGHLFIPHRERSNHKNDGVASVEADDFEHVDHLLVEMARVQAQSPRIVAAMPVPRNVGRLGHPPIKHREGFAV
jgi:hypothetical protein